MNISTEIDKNILNADNAICENIKNIKDRGLLSQNILSQLRNLMEHVSLKIYHHNHPELKNHFDDYKNIQSALRFIKSRGELFFLTQFHSRLQISASHYTLSQENSERLMLRYYEYLLKIKKYLKDKYNFVILENISEFPINQDKSLFEYHQKIVEKIKLQDQSVSKKTTTGRYYIHKVKPFFINEEVYYEVTFYVANDRASKFDRKIAFTSVDIPTNYAANLKLVADQIDALNQQMPINIIKKYSHSIRPCEFQNFAKIFNNKIQVRTNQPEYQAIMAFLDRTRLNLVDIISSLSGNHYDQLRSHINTHQTILPTLDQARGVLTNKKPGSNVIRYLLFKMKNKIIKKQLGNDVCPQLSNLYLKFGSIPFDKMPYSTSLVGHNPRILDLFRCISQKDREHELFARLIINNTEHRRIIYTPVDDLKNFKDVAGLIKQYNSQLYSNHRPRRKLVRGRGNVFIKSYETDTLDILEALLEKSKTGLAGHTDFANSWLRESPFEIDSNEKKDILVKLFEKSKVVLIYGAAGTGKSTIINQISHLFSDTKKLYLATTNPAVENLKRRVTAKNTTFRTIARRLLSSPDQNYDLLFIDECSTVDNHDMVKILKTNSHQIIVLAGDICQIDSIKFGNWFDIIRQFMPQASFELKKPFRTKNKSLLDFWDQVRNNDFKILESGVKNDYSARLDESVFDKKDDEIVLCLNYDGLYGINNINNLLQSKNNNLAHSWGINTYKVSDPVLFNEIERFKPLIYNNLKGVIRQIYPEKDRITFDIEVETAITELDVRGLDIELIKTTNGKCVIRFSVSKAKSTDSDDDSAITVVPFQIAYAVSIHKAQGLEYNSVKIIIANEVDEQITHGIIYTAITRAKEKLKIYWSPEVEAKILGNLGQKNNNRDLKILLEKYPRLKKGLWQSTTKNSSG